MRNVEKDEIEMTARRKAMIEKGFSLFAEKGIESVGMQEVANACGLGIATLYRYYKSKMALVLDISTRKWEEYTEYINEIRRKQPVDTLTAAEELEFYLDAYMELYRNHKDLLCFNQNFNSYVHHEGATEKQLEPYIASISVIEKLFHSLYEKGKQDGTIRTEMPEDKMFATTAHIMMAVGVRYAQGLLYSAGNEADRTEEYELVKRMILRTFINSEGGMIE